MKFSIDEPHLCIARRWNSFTPGLPGTRSVGGGYFVSSRGTGIAIDPGFNFLTNLLECGYWPDDIDVVVMTHNHIDHTASFEALLMLLHRLNSMNVTRQIERMHRVKVLYNPGCDAKFTRYINEMLGRSELAVVESPALFERNDNGWDEIVIPDRNISIQPMVTYHREPDGNCESGAGVVLNLIQEDASSISLAITSDSAFFDLNHWESAFAENIVDVNWKYIQECAVVVGHLGTVRAQELLSMAQISKEHLDALHDRLNELVEEVGQDATMDATIMELQRAGIPVRSVDSLADDIVAVLRSAVSREYLYSNHLGIYGIFHLFRRLFANSAINLGIISEFGEELGSYRHRVARTVRDILSSDTKRVPLLTGDIGLRVSLSSEPRNCSWAGCGAETRALIECSSCHETYCGNCISEVCIKHKDKAMIYICPRGDCRREEYAPPVSRVPRVLPAAFD